RVALSAGATRTHRATPARVNMQVVEVPRRAPDGSQLGELLVQLRHQAVEDRLLNGVLATGSGVRVERPPTVVERPVRVPADPLPPRLELGDAHPVGLQPPGCVAERAALGETRSNAHRPALAERWSPQLALSCLTTQRVDGRVTTGAPHLTGSPDVLVAAQPRRDTVTGLSACTPHPATRAEPLGQAQGLDVLSPRELVSN